MATKKHIARRRNIKKANASGAAVRNVEPTAPVLSKSLEASLRKAVMTSDIYAEFVHEHYQEFRPDCSVEFHEVPVVAMLPEGRRLLFVVMCLDGILMDVLCVHDIKSDGWALHQPVMSTSYWDHFFGIERPTRKRSRGASHKQALS